MDLFNIWSFRVKINVKFVTPLYCYLTYILNITVSNFWNRFVYTYINIIVWCYRTSTLEAELAKCRSEIVSLEKELSEALHNNLMELSSRSSGNYINLFVLN